MATTTTERPAAEPESSRLSGVWVPLPHDADRRQLAVQVRAVVGRDETLDVHARLVLRLLAAELEHQVSSDRSTAEALIDDVLMEWGCLHGSADSVASDLAEQLQAHGLLRESTSDSSEQR